MAISIGDFPPLAVSETHIDNLCIGDTNGSIDITATDGKPGYDFLWSDGNTDEDRSGLAAGTYTVTVSDNCFSSVTISITISEPPLLVVNSTITNVSCFQADDGSIVVNVSGGVTPYSYLWSNGVTTASNSSLSIGSYTLTVTDANGCTNTSSYTITQPPQFFLTETHINVTCFQGGNGSIDLSPSGGSPPYSYLWSNGATTEDLVNLTASTYFVTVTEASNCRTQMVITITSPTQINATAVITDQNCTTNGSIDLTTSGGTPPYAWQWSNGSTTEDNSNLTPGNYTVQIMDENGCMRIYTYTIALDNNLSFTATIDHNATCLMNDGVATVNPSGGTGPYSYLWSTVPAQTTATGTGLPPGNTKVLITDNGGSGCSQVVTITVPNTNGMGVALTSPTFSGGKHISCNGGSDGSATATPLYSTGPYTYIWSNGATTATITGLTAGIYTVSVSNLGCRATGHITLTQPNALIATATKKNENCGGSANGTATASQTGGTGPYSYSWNSTPVQTTKTATGLTSGTYTVTVSDANGCTSAASVTLVAPAPIVVSGVVVNLNCNNINTGKITLTVSGGDSPYTFQWDNGTTAKNRTGLAAGTYTVTVTDTKGCTVSASYTVTQPTLMVLTTSKTNVLCNGGNTGTATVNASGGTPGYTYSWNTVPVQTTATATGLTAGNKTVIVKDANNCSKSVTVTINQPSAMSVSSTQVNVTTNGGSNGSATANPAGGVAPYTYSWNTVPVKTTKTATGLTAGTYTVTVTDANGCTKTKSVTITQPGARLSSEREDMNIIKVNLFPNPSSGLFYLEFESLEEIPYSISLFNLLGKKVYDKKFGASLGKNKESFDFTSLPKGIYILTMETKNHKQVIRLVIQ